MSSKTRIRVTALVAMPFAAIGITALALGQAHAAPGDFSADKPVRIGEEYFGQTTVTGNDDGRITRVCFSLVDFPLTAEGEQGPEVIAEACNDVQATADAQVFQTQQGINCKLLAGSGIGIGHQLATVSDAFDSSGTRLEQKESDRHIPTGINPCDDEED